MPLLCFYVYKSVAFGALINFALRFASFVKVKMPFGHIITEPARISRMPTAVYCYICGRQFGTKSIEIHQPKCLEKWRVQNQKLPKHQRKAEPVKPEIIRTHDGGIDMIATNEAMYQAAQQQLVGCEHCGRTFNPDRLEVHQRSCSSVNPAKSIPGSLKTRHASPARGY
ncbi:hypothetical protein M3Y97_00174100 [Aphelenchoides bicaudatus]|nr:hypothetical protein M3Y97_00174100 [Aphelenchoides bicaudatus]